MRDRCNINTYDLLVQPLPLTTAGAAVPSAPSRKQVALALDLALALDHYTNSSRNCFGLYSKHLCRFGDCLRALVMARRGEFDSSDERV